MMKNVAFAVSLLFFALLAPHSADALYSPLAVGVPFGAVLDTGKLDDADLSPAGGSTEGVACMWYNSTQVLQNGAAATFMAGTEYESATESHVPIFAFTIVNVNGTYVFEGFWSDGGRHYASIVGGRAPLPMDGKWHYIGLAWSFAAGNYQAKLLVDLTSVTPAVTTDGSGAAVTVPWRAIDTWLLFADETLGGMNTGFYQGAASQWYLHVGNTDYMSILMPNRALPGCAKLRQDTGAIVPVHYGAQCVGPMGPPNSPYNPGGYLPILCLAGNLVTWPHNQGGHTAFSQVSGAPLYAPQNDPFSLYLSP